MVEIVVYERGWVTLSANLRGIGVSPTNDCWLQKTRVSGLSHGVTFRDPTFSRFDTILVCDTDTHDDGSKK